MNLQKLQTQKVGHLRFIVKYLEKIEEAKEEDSMVEFDAIFAAIEGKVHILETLNDKILSQTARMELRRRHFKPACILWN